MDMVGCNDNRDDCMGRRMHSASQFWNKAVILLFGLYNYKLLSRVIHGCIEDQYGGSTVCIKGGLDGEEWVGRVWGCAQRLQPTGGSARVSMHQVSSKLPPL